MEKDLKGKVVVVTVAASGIGKATAQLYAAHGAKLVLSDVDDQHSQELVQQIEETGAEAIFVKADVSNAEACEQLVKTTIEIYGRLDIAFNNAGIGGQMKPITELSVEDWNKVISINLSSVFYCMKYQLAQMLKQGSGVIVNNSSILGSVGFANAAGYVAAKHGVIGLTQNAGLEYSSKGIRINAVGPGFIKTPMVEESLDANMMKILAEKHAVGRMGESTEIAELVVWLSSDKASFVTGCYYPDDGGYLAQ